MVQPGHGACDGADSLLFVRHSWKVGCAASMMIRATKSEDTAVPTGVAR